MKIFSETTKKEDLESNNLEKTMKEKGNSSTCTQSTEPGANGPVPESYKPFMQLTLGEKILAVISFSCQLIGAVGMIYTVVICFIISCRK